MNRIALTICSGLFAGLFASVSHAATVVIVTDQPGQVKAKEVVSVLKSTPPFSRLRSFNLKIQSASTKTIGCNVSPIATQPSFASMTADEALRFFESNERLSRAKNFADEPTPASCAGEQTKPTRLITCNTPKALAFLGGIKARAKADHVLVVLDIPRYGGSGGTYPVMTTASPATMMVHEFLHQLGFADEYAYISACEADTYCDVQASDSKSKSGYGYLPGTSFNVALFNAYNSYIDDEDVRNRHSTKIPWVNAIERTTPLQVAGKLGTPASDTRVGVHEAIVCSKASRRLETWQPDPRATVMQSLKTNYVPQVYWNTVAKSLGTTVGASPRRGKEKVF